jgi:hypothetical protein
MLGFGRTGNHRQGAPSHPMNDETVDCFNCGRQNPEWAQVCRSCGVTLRHGEERVAPSDRLPTDQASLISIGAVLGTILLAVFIGVFVSGLNPTEPTVGLPTATPEPSIEPATPSPSAEPIPSDTPDPTPEPTPELRGTLTFGTGLDDNRNVTGATDTFTPSTNFAYSLSVPESIGGTPIRNEIIRTSDPEETVVPGDEIAVSPDAQTVGFSLGNASGFVRDWGPGEYVWRVYVGEELVAEAPFRLAEG